MKKCISASENLTIVKDGLIKLPLNAGLDLITVDTLLMNLILAPAIALGVFGGKKLISIVPQHIF